jgi:predicted kinase
MAVVHLIHGYLGAGKTTFARDLAASTGALSLSSDEWYLRLFTSGEPTSRLDEGAQQRLGALLYELWPSLAAKGLDVVLDFGFWTRGERDQARRLATAVGATVKLYWVRCSEDDARLRVQARNGAAGQFFLDDQAFEALKAKFQPLEEDEEYEEIRT